MFTKNWYKLLGAYTVGISTGEVHLCMDGSSTRTFSNDSSGTQFGISSNNYRIPSIHHLRNSYSGGVLIGTGTTPPTVDDYYLSGDMITDFASTTNKVTHSLDADGPSVTAEYTITNTGSKAFTIGEVALMAHCSTDSSTGKKFCALFERTVLDSPITIEPGGVGQLTYTLRYIYPKW